MHARLSTYPGITRPLNISIRVISIKWHTPWWSNCYAVAIKCSLYSEIYNFIDIYCGHLQMLHLINQLCTGFYYNLFPIVIRVSFNFPIFLFSFTTFKLFSVLLNVFNVLVNLKRILLFETTKSWGLLKLVNGGVFQTMKLC